MRRILLLATCAGLAGCATPYQENGLMGGVSASRITDDTVQISSRGNGYTSADVVGRYALRRAAEETIADGFTYFAVVSAQDASRHGVISTPGTATTTAQVSGFGNYATGTSQTTYMPGSNIPYTAPGENMTIKMFKGAKPADAPANVYDAAELLRYLVPPAKG